MYLALAAALFVLWRKFGHHLQSRLDEWRHRRELDRQAADIKKNPDAYRARSVKNTSWVFKID